MDLPIGTIRIRSFGGAAGQKGLKNIIDLLKTNKVPRVRIGIDKNPQIEAADYVLGKFEKASIPLIQDAIIRAKEAALMIVSEDVETAMNTYNMKNNGNNTTTD
jgi:PTH1 family peptidyl-tRNA hydrolase